MLKLWMLFLDGTINENQKEDLFNWVFDFLYKKEEFLIKQYQFANTALDNPIFPSVVDRLKERNPVYNKLFEKEYNDDKHLKNYISKCLENEIRRFYNRGQNHEFRITDDTERLENINDQSIDIMDELVIIYSEQLNLWINTPRNNFCFTLISRRKDSNLGHYRRFQGVEFNHLIHLFPDEYGTFTEGNLRIKFFRCLDKIRHQMGIN